MNLQSSAVRGDPSAAHAKNPRDEPGVCLLWCLDSNQEQLNQKRERMARASTTVPACARLGPEFQGILGRAPLYTSRLCAGTTSATSTPARAPVCLSSASQSLGHADIATMLKHHLHLFNDDLTDDMDRLAAVASRPALARIGG